MRIHVIFTIASLLICTAALARDEWVNVRESSDSEFTVSLVSGETGESPSQTYDTCCDPCGGCDSCGGFATPWHPSGDLHPHYPYEAWPKTYYYFRPYNYRHVRQQQAQAAEWGASAGLPYSNEIFRSVYSRFESP